MGFGDLVKGGKAVPAASRQHRRRQTVNEKLDHIANKQLLESAANDASVRAALIKDRFHLDVNVVDPERAALEKEKINADKARERVELVKAQIKSDIYIKIASEIQQDPGILESFREEVTSELFGTRRGRNYRGGEEGEGGGYMEPGMDFEEMVDRVESFKTRFGGGDGSSWLGRALGDPAVMSRIICLLGRFLPGGAGGQAGGQLTTSPQEAYS